MAGQRGLRYDAALSRRSRRCDHAKTVCCRSPPASLLLAPTGRIAGRSRRSRPRRSRAPVMAGDLEISAYRAKAMLPGQPVGGGYLSIANKGTAADRLVAATSPSAGMVEIHTMEIVNDVMTMRPVEGGLEIPAGATVELKPGGTHLMFMAVTRAVQGRRRQCRSRSSSKRPARSTSSFRSSASAAEPERRSSRVPLTGAARRRPAAVAGAPATPARTR